MDDMHPMLNVKTSIPKIVWPALPKGRGAALLALQFQLEQTQWYEPESLLNFQSRQLVLVLRHAARTVPFYQERFRQLGWTPSTRLTMDRWLTLPLLSRRDIQTAGAKLHAREVPSEHGRVSRHFTGGSTGQPVMTLGTSVTSTFWQALTLRDHLWHRRDLRAKLGAIRYLGGRQDTSPQGVHSLNWGAATSGVIETGPCAILDIRMTSDQQLAWLERENPEYLLTYPSVVHELVRRSEESRVYPTRLKQVRSFGELLEPHHRHRCQEVWNVPIVDTYSSEEVGYIALQCPQGEHYHLQSENLLVEILDQEGHPCPPGTIGRVVVTTLHNFAMPLLRYDLGDFAEVGTACPCGRGLPTVTRILGRQRGMFVMPNGQRRWPVISQEAGPDVVDDLALIHQFQVIQRTLRTVELLLVTARNLTPHEERRIIRYIQDAIGYPFEIHIHYVDGIERSACGKYEDFRSDVDVES